MIKSLLIINCFITSICWAQTSIYDKAFNFFNVPNAPGGIVAIGKGDSLLFKKAYGLANLETGEKITDSTMFEIASVSKQFTCFAIMLLEQEGKINWEDDVRKYIPELPFYGDTIRLRHCAHHTSGIRDWVDLSLIAGRRRDSVVTFKETLEIIYNQSETNFPVGHLHEYSNSGYTLLAEVINRVTEEGYIQFIKDRVFRPAGLETATLREKLAPIKNEATPYNSLSENATINRNLCQSYGAASILMNINDAIKWMQFLNNPPKEYKEIIKRMSESGELVKGKKTNYGYGFRLVPYKGKNVILHTGMWYGFTCMFLRFPDENVFSIIMNNSSLIDELWDDPELVYDSIFGFDHEYIDENWLKPSEYDFKDVSPEELKKFEGEFVLKREGHFQAKIKDKQLYLITPWEDEYPMYCLKDNKFLCHLGKITFKIKGGKVKYASKFFGPIKVKVKPYEASKTIGIKSSDLIGSYYNKDTKSTYQIKVEDCKLVLYNESHGSMPLKQLKSLIFLTDKWWMDELTFIKKKGKITGFKLPIGRLYGEIFFEKLKP